MTWRKALLIALLLNALVGMAQPRATVSSTTAHLDRGFRLLYDLDFSGAQQQFAEFERESPTDPTGPVSEAAGHLFSEFQRLGVLEAQFFENDKNFQSKSTLSPDPAIYKRFDDALNRAENLAQVRLKNDSRDRDALFAMTLASGLRSDYAALIEKRNLASLHYTKEATRWAHQLLAVDPECYDAHVATGISQYIIGSMAAPVRWLLSVGGIPGDKQAGIAELHLTAEKGRYLGPFARILLAIAYVREKDKARARQLLASLQAEFPQNSLFPKEIARLDAAP
jgi:hypothetical protein